MDPNEQSNPIESLDESELDVDQFVTKLSKKKVESIAEKVSWSSAGALVDTENAHTYSAAESASSSSKWLSSQKITERFCDNVISKDDDSLVVVCNRSARRMETHSESIVTRKIRSQIIEMDDEGNDYEEGDFFEEEQLISAPTTSTEGSTLATTKANLEETCNLESSQQVNQASIDVSSAAWLNQTKKVTSSCWSSKAMESIESVESCIEESIEAGAEFTDAKDDNQQVWSRMERVRDKYESASSSQSHHTWSSIHSESIESCSEILSTSISESFDDKMSTFDGNSSTFSRTNSHADDNEDDDGFEPDTEVAVSIRRPSQSLVSAEAYVFRQRKSLEELETEIVIRKKRKPKVKQEMVETATIFLSNSDSTDEMKETLSSLSSSSTTSLPKPSSVVPTSLPSLSSFSLKSIPDYRRESFAETLKKHSSLDTETDSMEDEDDNDEFESQNRFPKSDKMPFKSTNNNSDWNNNRATSTVFKSDQEINDLF